MGKQDVVSGRKIDLFMGEDVEVNHNTTINDKADAVSLSGQHQLMLTFSLVTVFPFSP